MVNGILAVVVLSDGTHSVVYIHKGSLAYDVKFGVALFAFE